MHESEAGALTPEQVIAEAAREGETVTKTQLERWHKRGLLPRPMTRSLGRGRGTRSEYPPETGRQAAAVARLLRADRDASAARWRLWWLGYAIADADAREILTRALDELDAWRLRIREREDANDDAEAEALEERLTGRLADPGLRQIRRRIGRARFTEFMLLLAQILSGEYAGVSEQDTAALLIRGMGLTSLLPIAHTIPGAAGVQPGTHLLRVLSDYLHPDALRAAFDAANEATLRAARDEAREFGRILGALVGLLERAGYARSGAQLAPLLDEVRTLTTSATPDMLLVWLRLRQHTAYPDARRLLGAPLPDSTHEAE